MIYHDRYFLKYCSKCIRFKKRRCDDILISNDRIDNCINNNWYEELR
jgi:hypothetical protein